MKLFQIKPQVQVLTSGTVFYFFQIKMKACIIIQRLVEIRPYVKVGRTDGLVESLRRKLKSATGTLLMFRILT